MSKYLNIPGNNLTDYDGWFAAQVDLMRTYAPACTNFRDLKMGEVSNGATISATGDAAIVQGGITPAGATATMFTRSVWQTFKTTSWAMAFRGIISQSSAGSFNQLGASNAANSHDCGFTALSTVHATHLILRLHGGTITNVDSGVDADDNIHDFVLTFNGTTLTGFRDGVSIATTTTLTNLTDEPTYIYGYNDTAGKAKVGRIAYGY